MFELLSRVLFPERCRNCTQPGAALCPTCTHKLRHSESLPNHTFAVYDYGQRIVERAIWEIKYHRKSELARTLARAALPFIESYIRTYPNPRLIPIPGSTKKSRDRGYNQAALLAKWWSKKLPDTRVYPCLHKVMFTLPQARCNRAQRLTNVRNSMECTAVLDPTYTYILIDDVTTTGSTFTEARRALYAAGAQSVLAIALAHGFKR